MTAPQVDERHPLSARSVSRSHVGRVRLINEDRIFDCPERLLWAVADGMGGHSGGDIAAQMTVDALREDGCLSRDADAAGLLTAIERGNAAIVARNARCGTNAGSTIVAVHITGRRATIAWVGDSRAYLIRTGKMTQISRDHSVVQELVDAGLITAAAARRHPSANVVTRALGVSRNVAVATETVELAIGDRLLLCSDGLSRSLDTEVADLDLDILADTLLRHALACDGSDNIALVCVDVY